MVTSHMMNWSNSCGTITIRKPSVTVQQFKFHSHFRKPGQSVANFVAKLWQLSEHCDFGAVLDNMLCDRPVCGINNDAIQRCLLGETPPLTYKKVLEISQGMEMAANADSYSAPSQERGW